jgi:deoxyribose-phosphate aldolase
VQEQSLAKYLDQTLLKPETTQDQILALCKQARAFTFFGVCVNSCWVSLVKHELQNTDTAVVSVVGFPLGAMASRAKAFEAENAVNKGADEIDMVINLGQLKSGNFKAAEDDIRSVVEASQKSLVKVIIETSLLTEEEKRDACKIAVAAGAHFVKTSTGFNGGGATVEDIRLMREIVGSKMGVKASGGVKTTEQAWALIQAGATRIGTSSGVELLQGLATKGNY